MKYEIRIVSSIDYLIKERVMDAQSEGWELNGNMLLTSNTTMSDHSIFASQPMKRKIKDEKSVKAKIIHGI